MSLAAYAILNRALKLATVCNKALGDMMLALAWERGLLCAFTAYDVAKHDRSLRRCCICMLDMHTPLAGGARPGGSPPLGGGVKPRPQDMLWHCLDMLAPACWRGALQDVSLKVCT